MRELLTLFVKELPTCECSRALTDAVTLTLTVAADSFVDEASSHASGIPYYRTVAQAIRSARPTNNAK